MAHAEVLDRTEGARTAALRDFMPASVDLEKRSWIWKRSAANQRGAESYNSQITHFVVSDRASANDLVF
jgi:hypothetical protein